MLPSMLLKSDCQPVAVLLAPVVLLLSAWTFSAAVFPLPRSSPASGGVGVGAGVALGVGSGVALGVGSGVAVGVAVGVGVGVGEGGGLCFPCAIGESIKQASR